MARTVKQRRKDIDVVGAEDDVYPWRLIDNLAAVLLGKAPAHGDLHARPRGLDRREHSQISVQLVGCVFTHGARVDHHHVCVIGALWGGDVPRALKEARHVLRVMHVHLAAEGLHYVRACHRAHACPATESARVSRITVTLISPPNPKSFSICSAMVRASSAVPASDTLVGSTTTRSSRPAAMAYT